jgi:hypothetical protein
VGSGQCVPRESEYSAGGRVGEWSRGRVRDVDGGADLRRLAPEGR